MRKCAVLLLIIELVSLAATVEVSCAQSAPNSSVPELTIRIAAYPYDVPSTNTTTIDPYTGKETVTTQPGYHVENKTIEAVIKNNLGASYYNFRYKGHYAHEDEWNYEPFNPTSSGLPYFLADAFSVPFPASTSSYTVLSLYFLERLSVPEDGKIDVQVQALFGSFRAVPYGHVIDVGGPTYDFYFTGTAGNWSETVTFIYDLTSPCVSILSPEQNTYSTSDVMLSFTVNEESNQTEYSLDGKENVTISGNTTLTNLPTGQHSITVYAMDRAGNVGASEAVNFTVAIPFSKVTIVAIALVAIFGISAGSLLYRRKRKR